MPAAYLGPRPVPRPCTRASNPKVTSDPNLNVLPTPQATNPGAAPGNSSTALEGRGFKCSLLKMTLVIIYLLFIECVCVSVCARARERAHVPARTCGSQATACWSWLLLLQGEFWRLNEGLQAWQQMLLLTGPSRQPLFFVCLFVFKIYFY